MPKITINNFKKIVNREHWITQEGKKIFPHEFEDEHLANTIRFLHRMTHRFRLEDARNNCEMVQKTGIRGAEIEGYYRAYKRQMDNFLGDLTDKQWLKENSKIYTLLVEEAKYRDIDYSDKSTKVKYTGNITSSSSIISKFSYFFNS